MTVASLFLALEKLGHLPHGRFSDDVQLVALVFQKPPDFMILYLAGPVVFFDALSREDLGVDYDSFNPGGNAKRGVFNVACLLAENSPQQLFFGGELGFAFGRNLAHQDVVWFDVGADSDYPALVEVLESLFSDVGDVPGDLFLAKLGVPGHNFELLDVNRGKDVFLDYAFAHQDRVFEVVPAPAHESHHHVATEASSPWSVEGPSAMIWPFMTKSPCLTRGFWLIQVF